jgi:hypothetical protein
MFMPMSGAECEWKETGGGGGGENKKPKSTVCNPGYELPNN